MGALAVPTGGTLSSALREQRILGAFPGINRVLWSCRQSAMSLGWHRGVGGQAPPCPSAPGWGVLGQGHIAPVSVATSQPPS